MSGGADLADRLAAFADSARPEGDALEVLRISLLDWAAVAWAGRAEPVAALLRGQAAEEGGAAQAGLVGATLRVPARMAALVNGTTSHALDYDDTHFAHIGHPSVAVLPAALAAGELSGADGATVQAAALVGAEASIRVGVWLGRAHYQTGFHQTGTAGAFGATLAAGRVLGLDAGQMTMALGLVATRASGLKSQFGTMGKPLNAGLAAANGVEAALLAHKGLTSAPAAVDGPQGFGPTHHGSGTETAFDGLGRTWLFEGVSHKFHACCHGLHAVLEALADAPEAQEVAAVEIATHPRWLRVCDIAAPSTGLEAKFSYRHVTAMRLSGLDTARLESFTDAVARDPRIAALRARVTVTADEGLSEMQARVRITDHAGAVRDLFHDLDAAQPLADRRARVRAKARKLLGAEREAALWTAITAGAGPADLLARLGP
jgi:2-methylcitrate dehydratase PrpD